MSDAMFESFIDDQCEDLRNLGIDEDLIQEARRMALNTMDDSPITELVHALM